MKYPRLGDPRIAEKAGVVDQYSAHLVSHAGLKPLVAEMEKVEPRRIVQFRAVHYIASDNIEVHSFRRERHGQTENVRPVSATGKQSRRQRNRGCLRSSHYQQFS